MRVLESLSIRVEGLFHLPAVDVDDVALGPLSRDDTKGFRPTNSKDLSTYGKRSEMEKINKNRINRFLLSGAFTFTGAVGDTVNGASQFLGLD